MCETVSFSTELLCRTFPPTSDIVSEKELKNDVITRRYSGPDPLAGEFFMITFSKKNEGDDLFTFTGPGYVKWISRLYLVIPSFFFRYQLSIIDDVDKNTGAVKIKEIRIYCLRDDRTFSGLLCTGNDHMSDLFALIETESLLVNQMEKISHA